MGPLLYQLADLTQLELLVDGKELTGQSRKVKVRGTAVKFSLWVMGALVEEGRVSALVHAMGDLGLFVQVSLERDPEVVAFDFSKVSFLVDAPRRSKTESVEYDTVEEITAMIQEGVIGAWTLKGKQWKERGKLNGAGSPLDLIADESAEGDGVTAAQSD